MNPADMSNDALRTDALEALAVATDRTAPTRARKRARATWELLTAEIKAREGAAFQKRQARLLRGF